MSGNNPYTPPGAPISEPTQGVQESLESLNRIARGQRLVMFALLAQIVATAVGRTIPQLGILLVLAAFIFAVVALNRLASALGVSVVLRVLLCIGLIIPLLSLVILAVLSSRASRRLRAGGFRIGFLGARPRET